MHAYAAITFPSWPNMCGKFWKRYKPEYSNFFLFLILFCLFQSFWHFYKLYDQFLLKETNSGRCHDECVKSLPCVASCTCSHLWPSCFASHPAVSLPIQLPANGRERAAEDTSSAWARTTAFELYIIIGRWHYLIFFNAKPSLQFLNKFHLIVVWNQSVSCRQLFSLLMNGKCSKLWSKLISNPFLRKHLV